MSAKAISLRTVIHVFMLAGGLFYGASAMAATLYVDGGATGTPSDGSTWANAFTDIQSAVDAAVAGDEVWVAAGIYTGNGDNVVNMKEGVHLYGGFAGDETQRDARNWTANETIIDGEDTRLGVYTDSIDIATLDGFTIRNGYAEVDGGGMFNSASTPTINHCTFHDNTAMRSGGGMFNLDASPAPANCTFTENTAYNGAGMYNKTSSPTVINCTFTQNTAEFGGGICNSFALISISNSSFNQNSSDYGGGMFSTNADSSVISDCSFNENTAQLAGGGMCNCEFSATITNCLFKKKQGH